MRKKFLIFLLSLTSTLFSEQFGHNAKAQDIPTNHFSIAGVIEDTDKNPIPYATVFISTSAMPNRLYKAMACDSNGKFSQILPAGKYIVKFTSVGFEEKKMDIELDNANVDVGAVILQENITQLREITIKPLIEKNAREIVYNITSDPDRAKSSMLDIFDKIPFFMVINDQIVAENDPAKSILILRNGRQDALFSGGISLNEVLRKLPAMGFINIKILLEKPEKYKQFDYVITITSDKTQRLSGAVGESVASYSLDRSLKMQQKVTASANKTRMAGAIGYGWDKPLEKKSISSTYSSDLSLFNSNKTNSKTNTYSGNVHISHDISEKQFVSGKFSVERSDNNTHTNGTSEYHTGSLPAVLRTNNTYNDITNNSFEGFLSYHYDLKPNTRIFSTSYSFKALPSDDKQEQSIQNETGDLQSLTLKKTKKHQYSHYLSLDYMGKFSPKISFEGRTSLLVTNNDEETRRYNTSSGQKSEDTGAYAFFERPVRRIDGSFSLSWLTSRNVNVSTRVKPDYMLNSSRIKMVSGTNEPSYYRERNWAFNSDIDLRIMFNKKTSSTGAETAKSFVTPSNPDILNINYSINQSRPSYAFLSSYVDDTNPDYLVTGNPYLKNETVHSISTRFTGKIVMSNLSYKFSNDKITTYWVQNENDKIVKSFINGGLYQEVSLGLQKNLQLSKDFRKMHFLMLGISGSYTKEKIDNNNREKYTVFGTAMYQIRLFQEYIFTGDLFYNKFWDYGYNGVDIEKPFRLNLRISRSFRFKNSMKLESMIRCDDLFGWNRNTHYFVNSNSFRQEQSFISNKTPVSVIIRLNLGSFRVKPVKISMSTGEIGGFAFPQKNEESR